MRRILGECEAQGETEDAGVDTYAKSSIAPRNNAIAKIIPLVKTKFDLAKGQSEDLS